MGLASHFESHYSVLTCAYFLCILHVCWAVFWLVHAASCQQVSEAVLGGEHSVHNGLNSHPAKRELPICRLDAEVLLSSHSKVRNLQHLAIVLPHQHIPAGKVSLWTMPNSDRNSCLMRREGDGEKGKDLTVNYVSVKVHMKQHQTLISLERHYTKAHIYRIGQLKISDHESNWFCSKCTADEVKREHKLYKLWLLGIMWTPWDA